MESNLRSKLIRLAHENPRLRDRLLPLLKQADTAPEPMSDNLQKQHQKNIRRALIAIKTNPTPELKNAIFLKSIYENEELTDKQTKLRDALIRKYAPITRQMPKTLDNVFIFGPKVLPSVFGKVKDPTHVAFVEKYWESWEPKSGVIKPGKPRPAPLMTEGEAIPETVTNSAELAMENGDTPTKLKLLDALIAKNPDPRLMALREQVVEGKPLGLRQLQQVRSEIEATPAAVPEVLDAAKPAEKAVQQTEERQRRQIERQIDEDVPPVPVEIASAFTPDEEVLPPVATQPAKDIEELYKGAEEAQGMQLTLMNQGRGLDAAIGASVIRADKGDPFDIDRPGPIVIIGPQKKRARVIEKAAAEGQDLDSILDIVRSTVAVDSARDIPVVMKALRDMGMKIARKPKNRFAKPTDVGYRDLMFNVRYPNGHVGEIQINLKDMIRAKEKGHKFYETVRSIEAKASVEGKRTLTVEEQAEVDAANSAQLQLYNNAWKRAMSFSGKTAKFKSALSVMKASKYYEWNDLPVSLERMKFPVATNFKGQEVVVYDLKKFFREAVPISKAEYDKRIEKIMAKAQRNVLASRQSLFAQVVRLAHARPHLRADLLPLLGKGQRKQAAGRESLLMLVTTAANALYEVEKACKEMKAKTKDDPAKKKKLDDILTSLSNTEKTLDTLYDMWE